MVMVVMIEIVVALLMIVNGEIKEHRIQDSMSTCLKAKRIAMRSGTSRIDYQCIKSKAEKIRLKEEAKMTKELDKMDRLKKKEEAKKIKIEKINVR